MKICNKCNQKPVKSRTAKYCVECSILSKKERDRAKTHRYEIRNDLILKPGVGKGGNNAKGSDDSQFTTGIGLFHNTKHVIKEEIRYCERCNKDLKDARFGEWCTHHRDHNRANNVRSNFELLCIRCHNLEHHIFQGQGIILSSETIPSGSRNQEISKHTKPK